MSDKAKAALVKYVSCAIFTGLMAWGYLSLRDFSGADLSVKYRMLSDAFSLPGMLMILSAGLIWSTNNGALDGISYALGYAVKSLIPGSRNRMEKYSEYVERKHEKGPTGFGFLLISGAAAIAVSLVFLALFYSKYKI